MNTRVSLRASAITLVAVLMVLVACSKAPSDAQIASGIQNKLSTDSGLQGKQLVVQAANGTVTLSGGVDNDAERDAAVKYASSEAGVKQVVNNLQIATAAAEQPMPLAPQPETISKPSRAPRHHRASESMSSRSSSNAYNQTQTSSAAPAPMSNTAPAMSPAAAPVPAPPPQRVTIPSGTSLSVRLVDSIDSETAQDGQTFTATLNSALSSEGDVAVPAGYDVEGHIVTVHSAGRFAGQSLLILQLDRIKAGGKRYDIQTNQYEKKASSRSTNTAEKVGGGAILGAIIGGLAGGGKGAGIGAAAGAGVGGGVQAATKSKQIKLPAETLLNFTLQAPLTVIKTSEGPNSGRQRLDTNQDMPLQH